MIFSVLGRLRRVVLTTVIVGLLGAIMVRLGPGFDVDEQELDTRLSEGSRDALRASRAADRDILRFCLRYLQAAAHGDLGNSRSLNQPVRQLIAERLPLTLRLLGFGVVLGFAAGFLLALATLVWRNPVYGLAASTASGLCLSIPAAAIALFFLWFRIGPGAAIALAVLPYVYRYSKNVLAALYGSPHVLAALARGLGTGRVLFAHVVTPALPQLFALAGISVTIAFGAAIPVEVICDAPGIGQLAFQAALGRDLPLLVGVTMFVALMTLVVNGIADMFLEAQAHP